MDRLMERRMNGTVGIGWRDISGMNEGDSRVEGIIVDGRSGPVL